MFKVLDQISWPGFPDRPNEDSCGAAAEWAWVIDTSIFPGTPSFMHPKSDAAWLAAFATTQFSALAHTAQNGVDLARRVMEESREAFFARAPEERHDSVTWPVGALTLVRGSSGRLDAWSFADTTAYLRHPDGTVFTLGEAPNLRTAESAKAAELLQAAGCTPKDIGHAPAFRAWLAERRALQEQGRGIPLFGLDPATAPRLRHESARLPSGSVVLLVSDGLSALVDLYRRMDAKALIEAALSTGLQPLAAAARRIETEDDPDGRLYPRFKTSDDATALLLAWK
jgi:hypothetical protein